MPPRNHPNRVRWMPAPVRAASRGFTLIEMLAVVALLAILLALLLPAIRTAHDEADQTLCHINLHQLQAAMARVTAENSRIPRMRPLAFPVLSEWPGTTMPGALRSIIRIDSDIYHCPSDMGHLYTITGMSYYFNAPLGGKSPDTLAGTRYHGIAPASVPVLWDADNHAFRSTIGLIEVPSFHGVRHAAFLDGSVGSVTPMHSPMEQLPEGAGRWFNQTGTE